MNSAIREDELRRALNRYFEEFDDDQRIELLLKFTAAQPMLAASLDFPEEEGFHEVVKVGVVHFTGVIYLLFKDRVELPVLSEDDLAEHYQRLDGMIRYINGDEEENRTVMRLYPEPVLLHHVKDFILEHHEYLSEVQHYDVFLALGCLVDAFAQAKKRCEQGAGKQ